MSIILKPGARHGAVLAPSSKSQLHRLLICASLGSCSVDILSRGYSADIRASVDCLNALGARITVSENIIHVQPISKTPSGTVTLRCGESGSTLRFLLPIVGALGAEAVFLRDGRLPERPLYPLVSELERHDMSIESDGEKLICSGELTSGDYELPGNVSSQFISALLMALPIIRGESRLEIRGSIESESYIELSESVLALAGAELAKQGCVYHIPGAQRYRLPQRLCAEGDWSGAASFLCAGAFSENGVKVSGLDFNSAQGDRAVIELLRRFGANVIIADDGVTVRRGQLRGIEIDASQIPDLIPALAVVAAASVGETRIFNASRLRLKESDRLMSSAAMLRALGAQALELPDALVIHGSGSLYGGSVDSFGDHRIAMAAAIAACASQKSVEIQGSRCVEKSYPSFWRDFEALKGE